MAKNFKHDNEVVENITKSFFSEETLGKRTNSDIEVEQEETELTKVKRAYNKRIIKDNKTETVTLRFTAKERERLQELVINSESESVSSYIRKLLKKEGL